jgi:signal transduction histidine kinase
MKNELISRLAVQLDSPVQSLITAAGALDRLRDAPSQKTARLVEIIRNQAETLSGILESVGQASVLVNEADGLRREPTSLPDLLRRALTPLRDIAGQLEVEIKMLSPGDLKSIACDSETLTTALRAVIKNALENNRRGGEVRIEVHRVLRGREPWIEFKIADTGQGILEDDLDKVFDAFWQGPAGSRGKVRGIGLGLMVAKQVVERHRGRISITRRSPEGIEVLISLPQ